MEKEQINQNTLNNCMKRNIYHFSLDELLKCIQGKFLTQNIPSDASLTAIGFSLEKQSIEVVIESDTFEENFPGIPIRNIRPNLIEIKY